jgi:hypothetical protein
MLTNPAFTERCNLLCSQQRVHRYTLADLLLSPEDFGIRGLKGWRCSPLHLVASFSLAGLHPKRYICDVSLSHLMVIHLASHFHRSHVAYPPRILASVDALGPYLRPVTLGAARPDLLSDRTMWRRLPALRNLGAGAG